MCMIIIRYTSQFSEIGFLCFKCGNLLFGYSKVSIWHLKNIHSLVNGRYFSGPFTCMQDGCMRTFKNHVSTFKTHLDKKHDTGEGGLHASNGDVSIRR